MYLFLGGLEGLFRRVIDETIAQCKFNTRYFQGHRLETCRPDRCGRPYLNDVDLLPGPYVAFEHCAVRCQAHVVVIPENLQETLLKASQTVFTVSFNFFVFFLWHL